MDIQKIVTDLLSKLQADDKLIAGFKKDPVATVTKLVSSIDLNNDQIKAIVEAITAKLKLDDAKDLLDTIGGLFGKK